MFEKPASLYALVGLSCMTIAAAIAVRAMADATEDTITNYENMKCIEIFGCDEWLCVQAGQSCDHCTSSGGKEICQGVHPGVNCVELVDLDGCGERQDDSVCDENLICQTSDPSGDCARTYCNDNSSL
jgi:hypothetical protein